MYHLPSQLPRQEARKYTEGSKRSPKKNKNAILYMGNNGKRSVQRKYGKNETQKVFQEPVLQEDVK